MVIIEVGNAKTKEATWQRVKEFTDLLEKALPLTVPWSHIWETIHSTNINTALLTFHSKILVIGDSSRFRNRSTKESCFLFDLVCQMKHYDIDFIYVISDIAKADYHIRRCKPMIIHMENPTPTTRKEF